MKVGGLDLPRAAGVLLHPTSLPGGAIGDLGEQAYAFLDWLASAGQTVWQVLPLNPTDEGGSPYNSLSALAGNPLLISLEMLGERVAAESPEGEPGSAPVDFRRAFEVKEAGLRAALEAKLRTRPDSLEAALDEYRERHRDWLPDYALFRALREEHGGRPWTEWDPHLRDREPDAMRSAVARLRDEIRWHEFLQLIFDRQWAALRDHATAHGILIMGDIPIFVAHDSADVWANRSLFRLNDDGSPEVVAGVPPDLFSATGQRWGNPLYRWDVMRERGYRWWAARFRRTLSWVDLVRIDHFRGFESFWEVPATEETAVHGRWVPGPGADLFRSLGRELGELPVVAEDLGLITPEVEELRDSLELPGMRVLQFGFDGDPTNPHLPENYPRRAVVYTGTHDNDTLIGWWQSVPARVRADVLAHIGRSLEHLPWDLLELVFASDATLAIAPVQDLLGLGSEARMNTPGTMEGNWRWRLAEDRLTDDLARMLRDLTLRTGRALGTGEAPSVVTSVEGVR